MCASQFIIPDMAGTSSDLACNFTGTRSAQPNQVNRTPDFPYLHHSYCHPPSLSLSSTTLPSSQNTKLSHPSLSLLAMIASWHQVQYTSSTTKTKYSIHPVQHTPSTASSQDFMSSFHFHKEELTPECSFSIRRASLYNRPPSVSSLSELKGKVTVSHSHVCESTK